MCLDGAEFCLLGAKSRIKWSSLGDTSSEGLDSHSMRSDYSSAR